MKNIGKVAVVMIALISVLCACDKSHSDFSTPSTQKEEVRKSTLTAMLESAYTRTAIDDADKSKIIWQADDSIKVLGPNSSAKYTTSIRGLHETMADFTGDKIDSASIAVYPYQSYVSFVDGTLSHVKIEDDQYAKLNSFDPAAGVMVGKVADGRIAFRNIPAYLKVTTGFPCEKIEVRVVDPDNYRYLTSGNISFDANLKIVKMDEGSSSVELKPAYPKKVIEPGTYYIAIAPQQVPVRLQLSLIGTDERMTEYIRTMKTAATFVSNSVTDMGTYSFSGEKEFVCTQLSGYGTNKLTGNVDGFQITISSTHTIQLKEHVDYANNNKKYYLIDFGANEETLTIEANIPSGKKIIGLGLNYSSGLKKLVFWKSEGTIWQCRYKPEGEGYAESLDFGNDVNMCGYIAGFKIVYEDE